jgi:hypothetical protein
MGPALLFGLLALEVLSAQDLSVVETILRRSEGGPPVADPVVYSRGEPVFLTFRVGGFRALPDDKLINVAYTITTMDPAKRLLAEPVKGEVRVELAPEDKNWTPRIPYEVMIPPAPEPGTYSILIEVQDLVAVRRTTAVKTFEVKAPKPPGEQFAIANFRFQRSERAATGLGPDESFLRGDTLWARFDMAGYKFGPKNSFSIRYGFALKDATGKVLFEQPEAAAETGDGFYPKLYTSGLFSVEIGPTVAPGEYRLMVQAKDLLGEQAAESEHVFRVR